MAPTRQAKGQALRTVLLTGQSSQYHDWTTSSAALASRLRESGLFDVTVIDASPVLRDDGSAGAGWDIATLAGTRLVVIDYEGPRWPREVELALEAWVKRGGGVVIVHATDNAFPDWSAFQDLCGLGGWGGRDERAGPKVRWRDGGMVLDETPGTAMHPPIHDFTVTSRAPDHPIMKGLPASWLHANDELYSQLRGPARNLQVLATGWADPLLYSKATGEHEPVLMTITFGEGRVFHTTLGHVGPPDEPRTTAIDCVGFITTFLRGAEWAATGKVTQAVPEDFPSSNRVSVRRR